MSDTVTTQDEADGRERDDARRYQAVSALQREIADAVMRSLPASDRLDHALFHLGAQNCPEDAMLDAMLQERSRVARGRGVEAEIIEVELRSLASERAAAVRRV